MKMAKIILLSFFSVFLSLTLWSAEVSPREEAAIRDYLLRNDGQNYLVQEAFTEKFVTQSLTKVKRLLPIVDLLYEKYKPAMENYIQVTDRQINILGRWIENLDAADDLYQDVFKKNLEVRLKPICCIALTRALKEQGLPPSAAAEPSKSK